jgi:hypothetical protein
MTIVKCDVCNREFNKTPHYIRVTKHDYCSRDCYYYVLRNKTLGGKN